MSDHPFALAEDPFGAGHDGRFIFASRNRMETVAVLRRSVADGRSPILLTGEPGAGKTSIVWEALGASQPATEVAILAHPTLTAAELLEGVGMQFGLPRPDPPSEAAALAGLERHLRSMDPGSISVLVLDEAHGLSPEVLGQVRALAELAVDGRRLLRIVLVGLPDLERRLGRPEFMALRATIALHLQVHPLTPEETARYVHHRVAAAGASGASLFPVETCREIHQYTFGLPRDVNALAARALERAHRQGAGAVLPEHVRAAAMEARLRGETLAGPHSAAPARDTGRGQAPASDQAVTTAAGQSAVPQPTAGPAEPSAAPAPVPAGKAAQPVRRPRAPRRRKASAPGKSGPDREPVTAGQAAAAARAPEAPGLAARASGPSDPATMGTAIASAGPREATPAAAAGPAPGKASPGPGGEADDPAPREHRRHGPGRRRLPGRAIQWGLAAAALLVLGTILMRARFWTPDSATSPVAPTVAAVQDDPVAPPATPAARPTPARAEPARRVPPAPSPREAPPSAAPVAPAPVAVQPYGLEVGAFLDLDRASGEGERLLRETGLACAIIEDREADLFRVVVGAYPNRRAAERAADDLLGRGLVEQARVVSLPDEQPGS